MRKSSQQQKFTVVFSGHTWTNHKDRLRVLQPNDPILLPEQGTCSQRHACDLERAKIVITFIFF